MWMWIIASMIVAAVAFVQFMQLRKEKVGGKEWSLLIVLYSLVFSGIVVCALELDSPVPKLIEWVTPFTNGIYRLLR